MTLIAHDIDAVMRMAPVIPVLVMDDPDKAIPVAEALVAGGLRVLEVTLRTDAALDIIERMSSVPGAVVGAGTVLSPEDLERSLEAGAQFIVSPGLTDRLADAAKAAGIAFLPGIANAGDMMRGLDKGLNRFKFFPAEAAGGLKALKALSAPFRDVRFCPTGGITPESAALWLAEPSVLCVGGSWLVPAGLEDPKIISANARQAASLRSVPAGEAG